MLDRSKTYRTFVTVGTHEQPFDRLIQAVDSLAAGQKIPGPVFMQIGPSKYAPAHCDWERYASPGDMESLMRNTGVIITHGGASTYMAAIEMGKVPIVVPRRSEFKEHVNDHQWTFAKAVEKQLGGIIVVENISDLTEAINKSATSYQQQFKSNTNSFCENLAKLINEI